MLEASLVVHYDDQASARAVDNRLLVGRALAEVAPTLVAQTVNRMLREDDMIVPERLRSTVGSYVVRPRPHIPVQLDLELIMAPDDMGALLHRLEEIRLYFADRVLDWFQMQHTEFPEFYQRMQLTAIRVTLWVGAAFLRLELNPATREVIASEGGKEYPPGYIIG